jgi:NADPH-dependent F420 reductase
MRIAIIGVGNVGAALARACVTHGHSVVLSARTAEHAAKAATDAGATAAASNVEAVQGADLVLLAVPAPAVAGIIEEIVDHIHDAVIVDPTNPAGQEEAESFDGSGSVAEGIQLLAPEARVVKAFNTFLGSRIGNPVVDGVRLDGFYAGNDLGAKRMVAGLLDELGFRPVDAGGLLAARALELMAELHIRLNIRNGWSWQSGWKLLGTPE